MTDQREVGQVTPSSPFLSQVRFILETATPERSPPQRLPPSPWDQRPGELPITASPGAITLKEAEPITLLQVEGERDLPEITVQEIDMLMDQGDFLVSGEGKPRRISSRKRRAEEESAEGVREQELLASTGLSPPTRIGEEPPAAREAGELLLTDKIQPLGEPPLLPLETTPFQEGPRLPPSPQLTPLRPQMKRRSPPSPELQLPPYEPSFLQPGRRRKQLRFLDPVTQISAEDFQKQILDRQGQCQPLETVLLPLKRLKTAEELLGAPTYGWMHPALQGLWARCAKRQRVDYAKQRAAEETQRRREEEEEVQRAEVPSELEELRAAEEPSIPPVGSSEISLETTEEESRPSFVVAEERVLLEPEEAALPIVPELPEISFELPLDKNVFTEDYVRRLIAARLEQAGVTEFDQLLPRAVSRAVASRFFFTCLVLAAAQFIHLEQAEAYGRIVITPGARFHQG
ncbi:meiotic recombination protein REC8 homolog [Zootoca vivipara]|uniref:meiotic recombination protein REC8 homolog n=1 Tax=Zootoca vivipara TaxID=8524 RepID=UPI00293B9534|nr:meiotic recombination protein REC8 homolog [Zootoca vivipara]